MFHKNVRREKEKNFFDDCGKSWILDHAEKNKSLSGARLVFVLWWTFLSICLKTIRTIFVFIIIICVYNHSVKDIILDTLDENAMIDLIPVQNDERMTDGNEEVIPESARKTPRRQRQAGIMQFFSAKKEWIKLPLAEQSINVLLLPIWII